MSCLESSVYLLLESGYQKLQYPGNEHVSSSLEHTSEVTKHGVLEVSSIFFGSKRTCWLAGLIHRPRK